MKKLITGIFILFFMNLGFGQKIKVDESTQVIEKISRTGLSTLIELDIKKVEKLWEKQLKSYGKYSITKGVYTLPSASIPTVSSKPCVVNSIVKSTSKGTEVWWSIDMGDEHVTSEHAPHAYKAAEKILYEFAASCYREDINNQIEEAEKALNSAVKDQEKEVREGESLARSVEKNKQEKANLEQRLKDNAAELVRLQGETEQNKKDQAAAGQDVEKMKKALEVVKGKMNTVGQ